MLRQQQPLRWHSSLCERASDTTDRVRIVRALKRYRRCGQVLSLASSGRAIRRSSRRLSPERLRLGPQPARRGGPSEDWFLATLRHNSRFQCVAAGHVLAAWRVPRSLASWRGRSRSSLPQSRVTSSPREPHYQLAFLPLSAACEVLHHGRCG